MMRSGQIFWSVFFAGILFMLVMASDGPVANRTKELIRDMDQSVADMLMLPPEHD